MMNESRELKRYIDSIIENKVRSMPDFKNCFRVQKAKVITAPNGTTCQVTLIGQDKVLTLPYSSAVSDISVGDIVWVGIIFNSLSNAIVWQKEDFS